MFNIPGIRSFFKPSITGAYVAPSVSISSLSLPLARTVFAKLLRILCCYLFSSLFLLLLLLSGLVPGLSPVTRMGGRPLHEPSP
jgi:hypothetical protein